MEQIKMRAVWLSRHAPTAEQTAEITSKGYALNEMIEVAMQHRFDFDHQDDELDLKAAIAALVRRKVIPSEHASFVFEEAKKRIEEMESAAIKRDQDARKERLESLSTDVRANALRMEKTGKNWPVAIEDALVEHLADNWIEETLPKAWSDLDPSLRSGRLIKSLEKSCLKIAEKQLTGPKTIKKTGVYRTHDEDFGGLHGGDYNEWEESSQEWRKIAQSVSAQIHAQTGGIHR